MKPVKIKIPVILIALVVAYKAKIVIEFNNEYRDSPLEKISNDEDTERVFEAPWLIIDRNVTVLRQSFEALEDPDLVAFVLSAPENEENRRITRTIFEQSSNRTNFKWFFVIGKTSEETQVSLNKEMSNFNDILQVDIEDKYENLSYKSLSAFAFLWSTYQDKLKWILKFDDDLDINLEDIFHNLASFEKSSDIHCPSVLLNMPNAIPKSLSSWERMPDFCNGFVYALQPRTALKLITAASKTFLIPLDDLFITGVLRGRLKQVGLKMMVSQRYQGVRPILQSLIHCPFLGVVYHFLFQDLAYQRGHWPWKTSYKIGCNVIKRYLDDHSCG